MLGGYDLQSFAESGASDGDITWSSVSPNEKTWSATFNGLKFKDGKSI